MPDGTVIISNLNVARVAESTLLAFCNLDNFVSIWVCHRLQAGGRFYNDAYVRGSSISCAGSNE